MENDKDCQGCKYSIDNLCVMHDCHLFDSNIITDKVPYCVDFEPIKSENPKINAVEFGLATDDITSNVNTIPYRPDIEPIKPSEHFEIPPKVKAVIENGGLIQKEPCQEENCAFFSHHSPNLRDIYCTYTDKREFTDPKRCPAYRSHINYIRSGTKNICVKAATLVTITSIQNWETVK